MASWLLIAVRLKGGLRSKAAISTIRHAKLVTVLRRRAGAWKSKWCLPVQGHARPGEGAIRKPRKRSHGRRFSEWFPGVKREQVEAVLDHAQRSLIEA